MDDLETRLTGALREVARHSPPAPAFPVPQELDMRPGHWRPMLAAMAVLTAIVGTGAAAWYIGADRDSTESTAPAAANSTSTSPASLPHARVDAVAEDVSAHYAEPGFGKVVVDYERGAVTVYWKGAPPAEVEALLGRQPNGVEVILQSAEFSQTELVTASELLLAELTDELGTAGVASVSPNADLSGVVAEIAKPWPGDPASLETVAGVPVRLVQVHADDIPRDMDDPLDE